MPTKRYSTEQIVSKLRQAEVELGRGLRVPLVCKKLGILASKPTTGGGRSMGACGSTRRSGSKSSSGRTRGLRS